jgi:hypothetical protein
VIAELGLGLVLAMPPKAKPTPPAVCRDKTALMLWRAGFRGERNRIAWAITHRESKHRNLDESSPWYTGALGIWQVQTSAHSGNRWWSRAAMLSPERQSRIVYLHMTKRGTYWRPWGITSDGRGMDTTHYGMWSSWQHANWIWAPYSYARSIYPKGCAR